MLSTLLENGYRQEELSVHNVEKVTDILDSALRGADGVIGFGEKVRPPMVF